MSEPFDQAVGGEALVLVPVRHKVRFRVRRGNQRGGMGGGVLNPFPAFSPSQRVDRSETQNNMETSEIIGKKALLSFKALRMQVTI